MEIMVIKSLRELEGNRTEVVCKNGMTPHREPLVRYFSVPTDKKDEFISEFEQKIKKDMPKIELGFLGASLLGGVTGYRVPKNRWLKLLGTLLGTLAFGIASGRLLGRYFNNSEKRLFEKFDVKEHIYSEKTECLKS